MTNRKTMTRRRRLPAALAVLASVALALAALLPAQVARADDEGPATTTIELRTSSYAAPTTTYRMYKIFDADYSGGWYNEETDMLYCDGVSWSQVYGQSTPAVVLSVLTTWREADDGPVDYYQWLHDNGYLKMNPSEYPAAVPNADELATASYDSASRVADYLNYRLGKDLEAGNAVYDDRRSSTIGGNVSYTRTTLPLSFANTLAEEFWKSGVPVGYTNEYGWVCATEQVKEPGTEIEIPNGEKYEDGYYVLVPDVDAEEDYSPIYVPVRAEGTSGIVLTVKGDLPRMVDKKVVRSKDLDTQLDNSWLQGPNVFVGSTTGCDRSDFYYTTDYIRKVEALQESDPRDHVGTQSVAVGGNQSTFTFATTFTVPSTVSSSDILKFNLVDELPPGLEYVGLSGRFTNNPRPVGVDVSDRDDSGNQRISFDLVEFVKHEIEGGNHLITVFYDVKLTDKAGVGWDGRNVSSAHLEYNLNARAMPLPNEDGTVPGDAETTSVSASVVTYKLGIRFEDADTHELIEDVAYPEDDNTMLGYTAYKGEHGKAELLFRSTYDGAQSIRFDEDIIRSEMEIYGISRAEAVAKLQERGPAWWDRQWRDADGWWWTDPGIGPTTDLSYERYKYNGDPERLYAYAIDLWPSPYPYTHPASNYVDTRMDSYYRFHVRSNLNDDGTAIDSLAAEIDETENWGYEPQVATDIAAGEIRVVVPLHKRDFKELPLTGGTPSWMYGIVGAGIVVAGSVGLAVYRRKTAQKAA